MASALHVRVTYLTTKRTQSAYVNFAFEPAYSSFVESNWKTHAGIQQQAVIAKVFERPPIPTPIQTNVTRQAFRKSRLHKVAARWTQRKRCTFSTEVTDFIRTGKQNVFHGRNLKYAIVRPTYYKARL